MLQNPFASSILYSATLSHSVKYFNLPPSPTNQPTSKSTSFCSFFRRIEAGIDYVGRDSYRFTLGFFYAVVVRS